MTPEARKRKTDLQRQRRKLNPNYWKKYYFENGGKERQQKYYLENKNIILARLKAPSYLQWKKEYKKSNHFKEKNKINKMKYKFGLTPEDYQIMLNKQNGCCAICGRHYSEFKKRLVIEHNHQTGKIRGLTCHNCNTILGHAHDNVEVLQKAIQYLLINIDTP